MAGSSAAKVVIDVVANVGQALTGLGAVTQAAYGVAKTGAEADLSRLGTTIGTGLKVGAGVGVAALAALSVAGVKAASGLEQSSGAIDSVFRANAGTMAAWAASAGQDVGLTKNEFDELGTLIGSQLKNGGTAMEQLAPKTNDLIRLGADLSSMYGGTTKDAVEALSSALKGERDPIERYGVTLNQASIDAEAASLGFTKVGGSLSAEATQAATLSLIMKQTADAHGNFAKEAGTLEGGLQRLTASWGNVVATLGTYLLPVMVAVVGYLSGALPGALAAVQSVIDGALVPAFTSLGGWLTGSVVPSLQAVGAWATEHKDALQTIAVAVAAAAAAFGVWQGTIALVTAVMRIAAVVQAAFNAIMAANPVLLIVMAIAALVAGLIYFFTQTETGKAAWAAFTSFLSSTWSAIVAGFKAGVTAVVGFFTSIGATLTAAWQTAVQAVTSAWATITAAVQAGINAVLQFLAPITTTLGELFSAAWTAVSAIITAAWETIKTIVAGAILAVVAIFNGDFGQLATIAQAVWDRLLAIFGAAGAAILGAMQSAWAAVSGLVSSAWAGIVAAVTAGVNTVVQFVASLPGKAVAALSALGSMLLGLMQSAWQSAASAVSAGVASVVSYAQSLPGQIISAISSVGSQLYSVGSNMMQGLLDGIRGMASAVVGAARGVVSDAVAGAKALLGIHSPSRVWRDEIGVQSGAGLIEGLAAVAPRVYDQARVVARGLTGAVRPDPTTLDISAAGGRQRGVDTTGTGTTVININVQATPMTDLVALGREIVEAIAAYLAATGRPAPVIA